MRTIQFRKSYDTNIKHLARHRLLQDILTPEQLKKIPRSNIYRWENEAEDKYSYSEINEILKQEVELIKQFSQSSKLKNGFKKYIQLSTAFHKMIAKVKGVKTIIKEQQELIVSTIEQVIDYIPIDNALKVFNISRATYQNYKTRVIYKCDQSYFKWCTKRFPNQLLPIEVETIKKYMTDENYHFWSKSSIYLKALRDGSLSCCLATFYNYCRLLGFKNLPRKKKSDDYNPIKTNQPNELWCADVTIFKTADCEKLYIHFLMDHYSKFILGYKVEKHSSGKAITQLLQEANTKHKPKSIQFLTDGGSENVNSSVSSYLNALPIKTRHQIAQKDVVFSNSMVEALNKTIKHEFLHPENLNTHKDFTKVLEDAIPIYNTIRPQMSLAGNTPFETYNGTTIDLNQYKTHFIEHKANRLVQNAANSCKVCH